MCAGARVIPRVVCFQPGTAWFVPSPNRKPCIGSEIAKVSIYAPLIILSRRVPAHNSALIPCMIE